MSNKIYKIRASNGTWVNKISGSGYIFTGETAKIWQSSTHANNAMDKCDAFSERYPEITFELKVYGLLTLIENKVNIKTSVQAFYGHLDKKKLLSVITALYKNG